MSVENSHKIARYYDYFRDKEVVFTKANLKYLRIDPRQIYIKCNGGQWPCIINSTSLQMAKIIIGTSSGVYAEISKKKDLPISIRYCFIDQNNSPIHFFVNCTVFEVKLYQGSNDLALVTLNFTQRPPDDLIGKIGEFVEVNENFNIRKEERIAINKNTLRELGILKEESVIFISNVPRRCIMKDLSFGGAKVMLLGIPKFLQDKVVELRILFTDTNEQIALHGTIVNAVFLEGRKDITIVNIQFNVNDIPMTYKFHINRYITSYQKKLIENQMKNSEAQQKAAAEEAKRAEEKKAEIEKRVAESKAAEAAAEAAAAAKSAGGNASVTAAVVGNAPVQPVQVQPAPEQPAEPAQSAPAEEKSAEDSTEPKSEENISENKVDA